MKCIVLLFGLISIIHAEYSPPRPYQVISTNVEQPQFIETGTDLYLSCGLIEHSARSPSVVWQKENGALPVKSYQNNGRLNIPNFQPEDSGLYKCRPISSQTFQQILILIKSSAPSTTTSRTFTVEMLPVPSPPCRSSNSKPITIQPTNFFSQSGDILVLTCHNSVDNTASVTWKKNSNARLPDHVIIRNGILIIRSVNVDDSGRYTCESVGGNGIISDAAYVHIASNQPKQNEIGSNINDGFLPTDIFSNILASTNPPTMTTASSINVSVQPNRVRQYRVARGEQARVPCAIENLDKTPTWRRQDGRSLPSNSHSVGSDLIIYQVQEDSAGIYECYLYDNYGDYTKRSIELIVFANTLSSRNTENESLGQRRPLSITVSPDSSELIVNQGEQLNLVCSADGYPIPRVHWRKLGQIIVPDTISSAVFRKSSVGFEDQGRYICVASNDGGTQSKSINLIVRSNPPVQYRVNRGDGTKISCVIENDSFPRLSWRRQNGHALPSNSRVSGGDLIISQVDKDAAGIYECIAQRGNNNNVVAATAEVIVIDSPQITFSPETPLRVRSDETVRIECVATGEKPITIEWRYEHNRPLPNNVQALGNYLQFNRVSVGNSGRYNCIASNRHGQTTKAAEITVIHNESHSHSHCLQSEFECRDHSCILTKYRCDGTRDCNGGEDEMDCPGRHI